MYLKRERAQAEDGNEELLFVKQSLAPRWAHKLFGNVYAHWQCLGEGENKRIQYVCVCVLEKRIANVTAQVSN